LKNVLPKPNLDSMTSTKEPGGGFLERQMLIAMPGMVDDNFAGSVTLMCQHSDEGAIGITINRLSDYTLGEIFSQLELDCGSEDIRGLPVLEGGPVSPDRGFVLHSPKEGYESSLLVNQDIMVTTSRDVLSEIAGGTGPGKFIVALGYAGWGGGQLEDEMLANAWLSVSADSAIVFDLPVSDRFDQAVSSLGISIDSLHTEAGHA
jgi:putative transcriptional regulator